MLVSHDGRTYGLGSTTQVVLKPVGYEWEVGTADRASYFPEARFANEDEACRFVLERLTYNPPPIPVHHPTPEEDAESERVTKDTVDSYLKKLRERGFKF